MASFALLLPQPSQTQGRAELQRFGLLNTSDVKRMTEAEFGLKRVVLSRDRR